MITYLFQEEEETEAMLQEEDSEGEGPDGVEDMLQEDNEDDPEDE